MAGAIDIHSHIAGWNVNTARLLLSEKREPGTSLAAAVPLARARSSTFETGCLYAAMGFTTVVEPAVSPHYALHAHIELADTPIIDKAILTILGNDDYLLGLLQAERRGCGDRRLRGVDTRNVARARHQGGQCRRRCGFQRQCAFIFIRRHRAVLRDVIPNHRQGSPARCGCAGRSPSAARALQQSRTCGQCRDRA